MIIIAGHIDFAPEDSAAAVDAGLKLQRETRELRGCLDYLWSLDPAVPGRVHVFERWEDEASLRAHFEGEKYAAMRQVLRGWDKRAVDIWKYRPDRMDRVYDYQGNPRADFCGENAL